ncbi:MAG: spermidine/putrescine transport system ATP-binding protein [Chloroflexi bacterium]|nr:MAG: spermidine/putrescine transport system ATP-binding protein [Chloroflexota bacterium]MBA4375033.1 ABC transporter ATP-binding protein [Anaerolinea sp.]
MDRLEIINVFKDYEGEPLLKGINFSVKSGETLCLLGRSGSGKSTLLRIIAGIETADSGEILWNGKSLTGIPTYRRNFGLMFQDYALFPHKNVAENVAFGLRMKGTPSSEISHLVLQALAQVNMSGFEERRVTDLSGGEQQRIALARALAPRPRLLMLDEPLAALDRALRMELQEELRDLLHKTGIPAIYVTHDQDEAMILGDEVAILAYGVIEQSGKPEEVHRLPKNRRVAEFLGMTNFIKGLVTSIEPLQVVTEFGLFQPGVCNRKTAKKGDRVTLLLKTTGAVQVKTNKQLNALSCRVADCTFRGDYYRLSVSVGEGDLMSFNSQESCPTGSKVNLHLPDSSVVCLDK